MGTCEKKSKNASFITSLPSRQTIHAKVFVNSSKYSKLSKVCQKCQKLSHIALISVCVKTAVSPACLAASSNKPISEGVYVKKVEMASLKIESYIKE